MKYVALGKTGLHASVAALGCGGASRLGQAYGKSAEESVAIVQQALDAGVNFIDTAMVYGTEDIVGRAIRGRRDEVIVSSKARIIESGAAVDGDQLCSAAEYRSRIEGCLKRLDTDYIDIFHLHGVMAHQIQHCVDHLVPELERAREQGKIRFIGITERFIFDTDHRALRKALDYDCWDVFMVGFNLLNASARRTVLNKTREKGIGTLCMFAVRKALSDPRHLMNVLRDAVDKQQLPAAVAANNPLAFLTESGESSSLQEAAYRFCRHEPGIDIVLTGTGNPQHLRDNLASINSGPLSAGACARIEQLFGQVDCLSGD